MTPMTMTWALHSGMTDRIEDKSRLITRLFYQFTFKRSYVKVSLFSRTTNKEVITVSLLRIIVSMHFFGKYKIGSEVIAVPFGAQTLGLSQDSAKIAFLSLTTSNAIGFALRMSHENGRRFLAGEVVLPNTTVIFSRTPLPNGATIHWLMTETQMEAAPSVEKALPTFEEAAAEWVMEQASWTSNKRSLELSSPMTFGKRPREC
jgi:hypothetical protein